MVRHLAAPTRPLRGGSTWTWNPRNRWLRIYHRDDLSPTGDARRAFGPLLRFDHHAPPASAPAVCPAGRTILYLAKTLRTAGAEVFGDLGEAPVCPHVRVAVLRPARRIVVQDIQGGGAMQIEALPAIGEGDVPRVETQAWARAIYEDQPGSPRVAGIRYSSAHDEGASLAVWETAGDLVVVEDHAIDEAAVFRRFLVAMHEVGIEVLVVPATDCVRCRQAVARGHPC